MTNGAYEGHMTNRKVRGSFLLLEQTNKKKTIWLKKEKEKKEKRKEKKRKEKKSKEKKERKGEKERK